MREVISANVAGYLYLAPIGVNRTKINEETYSILFANLNKFNLFFSLRRSDIANPSNGNILVKVTLKMFVQSSSLGSVRGAARLRTTILSLLKEIRTYLCNYF